MRREKQIETEISSFEYFQFIHIRSNKMKLSQSAQEINFRSRIDFLLPSIGKKQTNSSERTDVCVSVCQNKVKNNWIRKQQKIIEKKSESGSSVNRSETFPKRNDTLHDNLLFGEINARTIHVQNKKRKIIWEMCQKNWDFRFFCIFIVNFVWNNQHFKNNSVLIINFEMKNSRDDNDFCVAMDSIHFVIFGSDFLPYHKINANDKLYYISISELNSILQNLHCIWWP